MKKQLLTLIMIFTTPLLGMDREKQVIPFMELQVNHNQAKSSSNPKPVSFRELERSGQLNPPNPIYETGSDYKEESHCCRNHVGYCAWCLFACAIGTSAAYDCCCGRQGCSEQVNGDYEESKKMCSGATYYFFCSCR